MFCTRDESITLQDRHEQQNENERSKGTKKCYWIAKGKCTRGSPKIIDNCVRRIPLAFPVKVTFSWFMLLNLLGTQHMRARTHYALKVNATERVIIYFWLEPNTVPTLPLLFILFSYLFSVVRMLFYYIISHNMVQMWVDAYCWSRSSKLTQGTFMHRLHFSIKKLFHSVFLAPLKRERLNKTNVQLGARKLFSVSFSAKIISCASLPLDPISILTAIKTK